MTNLIIKTIRTICWVTPLKWIATVVKGKIWIKCHRLYHCLFCCLYLISINISLHCPIFKIRCDVTISRIWIWNRCCPTILVDSPRQVCRMHASLWVTIKHACFAAIPYTTCAFLWLLVCLRILPELISQRIWISNLDSVCRCSPF